MMSGILDPGEDQDLGQDFHFESDPLALESILNHRGLNPGSLQPQKSDYEGLKNRLAKVQDKFDFFEGKNGMMFYRPSAKFNREEMPDAADGQQSQGFRAMRAMKSKGIQKDSFKPRRSLMRTPGASAKKPERPPKSRTKTPNSHVFKVPSVVQTEKKLLPFVPAPHRQSISERKPLVPRNLNAGGGIKKSLVPTAKKTLDFREEPSKDADENNVKEDSFEFARPLNPSQFPTPSPPAKSKVELILMREGLVGLPRESMSFLLRQSLSKVELDRMFEDDSTESFEALERRLKTPKKSLGRMSMSKNGAVKKSSVTVAADMLNDDLAKKEEEEDWAVDRKLSMIAKKGKMRAAEIKMAKSDPEEIEPVIVEESASNEREKSAETAPCQSETISEEQKAECVEEEDAEGEVEAPADDGLDDDDDLETDADYEVSFLRRSASMLDISSSAGEESLKKTNLEDKKENEKKMADTTAPLQLARSVSEADLSRRIDSAPQPVSQFLLDALEAHRQHLEEQEEIERQMLALMSKAKSRREEFRKTWGVSPKSINRKRTIKTVQTEEMEVNFSPARTTTGGFFGVIRFPVYNLQKKFNVSLFFRSRHFCSSEPAQCHIPHSRRICYSK